VTGLFFEASFVNANQTVSPPSTGDVFFVFDIMSPSFPRGFNLSISIRAVLKSNPFLASAFTSFDNVTLPRLPIPNISAVLQQHSSFTVYVDPLPPNLPSATGFIFSFRSGKPDSVVVNISGFVSCRLCSTQLC
jgi:hypothetical protein